MPLNIKRIENQLGCDEIALTPYSFTQNKAVAIPKVESLELSSDFDNQLCGCIVASLDGYTLIRSNAIDTLDKVAQFQSLLKILGHSPKQRLCSIQLDAPENDWLSISKQHQHLFNLGLDLTHLNITIKPLFITSENSEESPTVRIGFENLSTYLNATSWIHYCHIFEEEIAKVRHYLNENGIESFTLRKSLDGFVKAAHGDFLKKARKKIEVFKQKIAAIEVVDPMTEVQKLKLLFLQKDLLAVRYELVEVIRVLKFYLNQILTEAKNLELTHPFLTIFRQQAELLNQLVGSQTADDTRIPLSRGQQIIMLQLLNVCMGVRIWSCSENGFEKTCFVFPLKLAVLMMLRHHTLDELIHLMVHWESKGNSVLANLLKKTVWNNFVHLSQPFIQKTQVFLNTEDDILNSEWMEFFPDSINQENLIEHLVAIRGSYGQ